MLLPAPAGMIPVSAPTYRFRASSPRTRGDDPVSGTIKAWKKLFSPHPRG